MEKSGLSKTAVTSCPFPVSSLHVCQCILVCLDFLKCVNLARNPKAIQPFLTGGAHRESPELPLPKVCEEVCHRLLLWNSAETEVWDLWHRQQNYWPEWRWLPGATGVHLGPGKTFFSYSGRTWLSVLHTCSYKAVLQLLKPIITESTGECLALWCADGFSSLFLCYWTRFLHFLVPMSLQ